MSAVLIRAAAAALLVAMVHPAAEGQGGGAARVGQTVFLLNEGQVDEGARFMTRGGSLDAYFTDRGLRLQLVSGDRGSNVFMTFEGASEEVRLEGARPRTTQYHFLQGSDAAQWRFSVPAFAELRYREIYPGVEVRFYDKGGALEYDLELAPGAPLDRVVVRCEGAISIALDDDGSLIMNTVAGPLRQSPARTWCLTEDGKKELEVEYRLLADDRFGFSVPRRAIDERLIIDPGLSFGTYLGGSSFEDAFGVSVEAGDAYVTGNTISTNFPVAPGAFDPSSNGGVDAFVSRFSSGGSSLIYSTYLGGAGNDDGQDIAALSGGSAFAVGTTSSAGFPVSPSSHDQTFNGSVDGWVMLLGASGVPAWSTFLGGSAGDDPVAVVPFAGGCQVGGTTSSVNFPAGSNGYDVSHNGAADIFVTSFDATGNLSAATLLGGNGNDRLTDLFVSGNRIVIAGESNSANFPTLGAGGSSPFQGSKAGGVDAVVARLTSDLTHLLNSTLIGGTGDDIARSVVVDPLGRSFVLGETLSSDFPVTAGALDGTYDGAGDLFVLRLNTSGSALFWSTLIGGPSAERAARISMDSQERPVVAGDSASSSIPVTDNAYQSAVAGSSDAIVLTLAADGASILYGTYYGGVGSDVVADMVLDDDDAAYLVGATFSSDLPGVGGSFDDTWNSKDAYLVKVPTRTCGSLNASSVTYGVGKSGTFGVPVLSSVGTPGPGSVGGISITNGLPGAPVTLFLGFQPWNAPFDGGTLLVIPTFVMPLFPLNGAGGLEIAVPFPDDPLLCGLTLYFQAVFPDPGSGPGYGLAHTNGLTQTFGSY